MLASPKSAEKKDEQSKRCCYTRLATTYPRVPDPWPLPPQPTKPVMVFPALDIAMAQHRFYNQDFPHRLTWATKKATSFLCDVFFFTSISLVCICVSSGYSWAILFFHNEVAVKQDTTQISGMYSSGLFHCLQLACRA